MQLGPVVALALTGALMAPVGAPPPAPGTAAPPTHTQTLDPDGVAELAAATGELAPAAADGTRTWVVQVDPDDVDVAAEEITDTGARITAEFTDALTGFTVEATDNQIRTLAASGVVEHAEPDVVMSIPDTPTRPAGTITRPAPYIKWNLDRVDQRFLPMDGTVTTPDNLGQGVIVYVVDSGIDDHPELVDKLAPGHTQIHDGYGTGDCHGHGTHVAGTIASASWGLAPEVTIVPVRVLGCDGKGLSSGTAAGVDWIVANHPKGVPGIINMSLTGPRNTITNAAVANAHAAGLLVVVAAGNDTIDACLRSPAMAPQVITVGATTRDDQVAGFSNYGPCLDVWAPGSTIPSTYLDNSYVYMSGTSMASPLVAAIAAIHAANGITGSDALAEAIVAGATPILDTPPDTTTGLVTLFTNTDDLYPTSADLAVDHVTHDSVTLTATFPPGGAAVEGVTVQTRTPTGSWTDHETDGPADSYTVAGLTARTEYEARLVAHARGGFTTTSAPVTFTTGVMPPSAPSGLVAAATAQAVTITWDAAGPDVTGHTVELSTDAGATWQTVELPAETTTHTFTALPPGADVAVRVRAHVDGTPGAWAHTAVTTATVPAPGDLTATAQSPTTVAVQFTAPDTGDATLTGYQVQWSTDATFTSPTSVIVTDTEHTLTVPGAATVHVRVRAQVEHGWGQFTTPVKVTTPHAAPSVPRSVSTSAGTASLKVRWVTPATALTAVTGYQVAYTAGSSWTTTSVPASATEYTFTGLAPSTSYQVRVRALSGTQASDWVTVTGKTAAVPAPSSVRATPAGPTSVGLSWAAPNVGDAKLAGYQVQVARTTAALATTPARSVAGTSYTWSGLVPNTRHYVRMRAVLTTGVGAWSSAVAVTTARDTSSQIVISPDLTGDGRDDILRIDAYGTLWLHPGNGNGAPGTGRKLGTGWSTTRLFAPGDWDGDGRNDLISTTADGKLWLHPGTGTASAIGPRRQIGHGWQTYRIVPVGDANNDGKADLFGIDSAGRLWLYPGRGGGRFAARVQVGNGWNGYELYAAGDVNGDRLVDIYSIDSAGRLYQYRGRGGGRFYAKEQVGHGWNGFLFASGADLNRDGRKDLLGKDAAGNVYFYGKLRDGRFTKILVAKNW